LNVNNLILEPQKNLTQFTLNLKEKIKEETDINIFYRFNLQINEINEFKKRIKGFNKTYCNSLNLKNKERLEFF